MRTKKIQIQKTLLKDSIVRKRLSVANFYKNNVLKKNVDYIFFIPTNGFSSDLLQTIRTELKKYGFYVAKYTTKSFFSTLELNNFTLKKQELSSVYLGQMLVVFISLNSSSFRQKQSNDLKCLSFLQTFLNQNKLPIYSNLAYIVPQLIVSDISYNQKSLVVNSVSEKYRELEKVCTFIDNKNNLCFYQIPNAVYSLNNIFILQILLLLQILNYKNNLSKK